MLSCPYQGIFTQSTKLTEKRMRKTIKSAFQEDSYYVILILRKQFVSMLNLSQAMQGPAEMVL